VLAEEPKLSGVRILEEIQALGYRGGKTILDDLLRELRPRYLPPSRSFQRIRGAGSARPHRAATRGPGRLRPDPQGLRRHLQAPLLAELLGALVFSNEFHDVAWV
jgi:hypothetical protein